MDEDSAMREGSLPVSWGGLRVTKQDSQFREKNVRKYLLNYVCAARDAIYKNAFAIGGAIIWGPTRQRWWCARGCNVAWCWYWRPYRIVVVPVVI
jgi:hypothetical protein